MLQIFHKYRFISNTKMSLNESDGISTCNFFWKAHNFGFKKRKITFDFNLRLISKYPDEISWNQKLFLYHHKSIKNVFNI